jgi:uncharacterized membrane protein
MAEVTMTVLLFDPAKSKPAKDESVASGHPEQEPKTRRNPFSGWFAGLKRSFSRPTTLVVIGSMLVGTVIRLDVPRGLWLDETISVAEAKMPYLAMIHHLATQDVHPPLYFSILWVSARVIGLSDYTATLPSILFGVLFIPMVYLLAKEAFDRKTGAVAAVLVSVAPFAVWYSQEARMYSLLMLLSALALWAQLRILRRSRWLLWVLYTLVSAAMVCTQYFGTWQLVAQQLVFIGVIAYRWRHHEKPWAILRGWLCSSVVLVAALIPLALMMKEQFANAQATGQAFRGASGAGLTIYSVMTNVGYALVGFHSQPIMSDLIALWPLVMLGALAVLGRRCKPVTYFLVFVVIVPVAAMFVLGDLKESLADIRYESTIVPVLVILVARAITTLATSKRALTVAVVVVVAGLSVALFDQQFSSSNPRRYNFREALHRVDANAKPGDEILYDPVNDQFNDVTTFYSPHVKAAPLPAKPSLTGSRTVYILSSPVLMGPNDHAVYNSAITYLTDHHKKPVERWLFPNTQVLVYHL